MNVHSLSSWHYLPAETACPYLLWTYRNIICTAFSNSIFFFLYLHEYSLLQRPALTNCTFRRCSMYNLVFLQESVRTGIVSACLPLQLLRQKYGQSLIFTLYLHDYIPFLQTVPEGEQPVLIPYTVTAQLQHVLTKSKCRSTAFSNKLYVQEYSLFYQTVPAGERPMLKFCTYISTACVNKLYTQEYSLC